MHRHLFLCRLRSIFLAAAMTIDALNGDLLGPSCSLKQKEWGALLKPETRMPHSNTLAILYEIVPPAGDALAA